MCLERFQGRGCIKGQAGGWTRESTGGLEGQPDSQGWDTLVEDELRDGVWFSDV